MDERDHEQDGVVDERDGVTPEERARDQVGVGTSPGEEETPEQGAVRTGRALPEHPANVDSAGLTPAATAAREEKTHAERDATHHAVTEQGHAADGDVDGGVRRHPQL